jgi:hypothetical protein
MRRILYPIAFVAASLMLAIFYPLLLLVFYAGGFVLLMLSRRLNLYRIVMMLKQAVRNFNKLRCDVRARLHLGFREYVGASADEEQLGHRSHGYVL